MRKDVTWQTARNSRCFALARKYSKALGLPFAAALRMAREQLTGYDNSLLRQYDDFWK